LAEQFILEEIIFRSVAAQGFERHPENKQPAINAVAPPGQLGPRRVKRNHDPDPEPEKDRDDQDLAEQENAIETLRALGDHDYVRLPNLRVRDGRPRSTRGKTGPAIDWGALLIY